MASITEARWFGTRRSSWGEGVHRGSFQLYIFFCIPANTLLIQLTGPSLDVSFAFSVGRFCGPRTSACVSTPATPDGERKRDEKSNPASHTADIQRRDKRHTTRQTMKNCNGFSIKQWYWLNWPHLQLSSSWPSGGRKWPWNQEIARQAWQEEVLHY